MARMVRSIMLTLGLILTLIRVSECKNVVESIQYPAISCRKHKALLTDFGGVGDGKTSNTKAFKSAVDHLGRFASDGGAQLVVPPGRWLTGSFNLASHFTLFIHKDATILASQYEADWAYFPALPSYGTGIDDPARYNGRFSSLIFGTNLTDVVITGYNGTIDGQGEPWWEKFRAGQMWLTRPNLIEIVFSTRVQISNLTLVNSPSRNVHPVYCDDVIVQWLTILAPVDSPNTDGIIPDSCTQVRVEDSYIVSGDDCIAVKSGWDRYGMRFGLSTEHLMIRRITCISPNGAAIALGSEMSGGIQDVRAEDITAIDTQSGISVKTTVGRGGFVRDIFVRRMTMKTMEYAFSMTGSYGEHPDPDYDPKTVPEITRIKYSDVVAENVTYSAMLEGIEEYPFTGICISNVTIRSRPNSENLQWNCTNISGVTSNNVTPQPCELLYAPGDGSVDCAFPVDTLSIDEVVLYTCYT